MSDPARKEEEAIEFSDWELNEMERDWNETQERKRNGNTSKQEE